MLATAQRSRPSLEQIWAWLESIPDPEIPAISIVDLGIVREVAWQRDECFVTVTPTYSGCPATDLINEQIRETLRGHGIERVRLSTRLAPAWTSDWLTQKARERLRAYGIVPPIGMVMNGWADQRLRTCHVGERDPNAKIACPLCGSQETEMVSAFGSTPCKSLHRCLACREPFDYFKCH